MNRSNGMAAHSRAIAFAKESGEALDVGCGCTGRFIDLLIEENFTVEGVDVSSKMSSLVRAKHPNIVFHQADICEWELPRKYNFISAWDSIWHVPLKDQEKVLRKLVGGLSS